MPFSTDSRTHSYALALPPSETAWLTYQALDHSADTVVILERRGNAETAVAIIIGANDAFRRASGYSDAQLLGHQVTELFLSGDDAAILMNAIRRGDPLRTELACSRASGGTFILGLHLMPAPTVAPDRVCFVLLGRDITAVLQARQRQDSIQRLLAKVFIVVDSAVAIINGAGRIVMTNPHVDRLLGYKPNGLVGQTALEVVSPASRASVAAKLEQQLEQARDMNHRTSLLRADGTEVIVQITSALVATDDTTQFRIVTIRPDGIGMPAMRAESAGKIKLVGLDEVRAALGKQWPAVAARAMATAEMIVKRRCGPQDSYSRADDTSFLVCFGALNEEEASFRAAMIGREIRDRLIGQGEDPDTADVRSIATVVRFPDQGESDASLHAALLSGLEQQLERLEQEARRTVRAAFMSETCELEPVCGRNPRETVATQIRLCSELERRLISALSVLPQKESKAFDLDGLLVRAAAQHAVTTMAQGDTTALLVDLRFDIFFTRATTERYVAACLKVDPRICGRLFLLLSSLPQGVPGTRLLECINRLRPFCCGVGYNVSDVTALASIDLSNSFNPIVALPAAALAGKRPVRLKELIGSLHARRAKVLIRRVASEDAAAAYRALGADMISMQQPVS